MSKHLLILRHAKSDWDSSAVSDFDRPLAKRGNRDAPLVGGWLKKQGWVPDYIISSPAQRAKQTALYVSEKLGIEPSTIHFDERVYLASKAVLRKIICKLPEHIQSLLLIGHNPGLDELLLDLSRDDPPTTVDGKLLTTAALAILEIPQQWSSLETRTARLLQLVRPKEIKQA